MSLLRFLGLAPRDAEASSEAEAIAAVARELDRLDPAQARYIAAFAYLLGRVAHVDQHVSDVETAAMVRILRQHTGLSEAQAMLIVQIAHQQQILFGGTEDFIVARAFAEASTYEQRLALLECLFAVSAADEAVAVVEDNEIRRISRELRIEHADFIRLRAAYRTHLTTLKTPLDPRRE